MSRNEAYRADAGFLVIFYNSVVFAVVSAGMSVFMGAMAGYVFARTEFPCKKVLSMLIIGKREG
ncbi:hypothetical protein [Paenibacillus sp. FSL R10-2736]|uniref:hypothetical protein n=1 Tax=Paenibacillus sp. FSL R10-2736 TaxID=2954692 RepID=UPI0030FAE52B